MGFMWIWWILIIVGIGVVIWFVTSYLPRGGGKDKEDTPEEVLKRRFAKGEIDQETYERMLQELRK